MGGEEEKKVIGQVVRPHGIKGEVKIIPRIAWPEGFHYRGAVHLNSSTQDGWFDIEHGRWNRDGAVLRFTQVKDRNGAEALRGCRVSIPGSEMPPLPPDVYYDSQLLGMRVRTRSGEPVGVIEQVLHLPAQDVYEIKTSKGMVMIPAVEAFVKRVDLEGREMTIEPIEGLLESDAD